MTQANRPELEGQTIGADTEPPIVEPALLAIVAMWGLIIWVLLP